MPGAAPARYGDRVGAVLAVRTREGRADGFHGKASLGAAGVFATLEGPIGRKASWLASARQSYLDYILERVDDDPRLALGYRDLTARLVAPAPALADALAPRPLRPRAPTRTPSRDPSRPHDGDRGRGDGPPPALVAARLGRAGPRGDRASSSARPATTATPTASSATPPSRGRPASRPTPPGAAGAHRLEGGLEARRIREDVLSRRFDPRPEGPRVLEDYARDGWLWGAFVQDTWAAPGGRASVTLGGRIDHWGATGETVVLPRASVDLGARRGHPPHRGLRRLRPVPALRAARRRERQPRARVGALAAPRPRRRAAPAGEPAPAGRGLPPVREPAHLQPRARLAARGRPRRPAEPRRACS